MSEFISKEKLENIKREVNEALKLYIDEKNMPKANILVAGITGSGKSTLINAVFGEEELAKTGCGKPVTDDIHDYENETIHIWDTVGLEMNSAKTEKSIEQIKNLIASRASTDPNKLFDAIHAIWYCINSAGNRYQGAELDFIHTLYKMNLPFIIVITQCYGDENEVNAFEQEIKRVNKEKNMEIETVQVLSKEYRYRGMPEAIQPFGLDNLVDITTHRLPEFIKGSFIAAQKVSRDQKREQCEDIIFKYVFAARYGFWTKVPLINILPTDARIKKMIKDIGQTYNTILPEANIEKFMDYFTVNAKDNFKGLVSPIYKGYSKKLTAFFEQKKEDGFYVTAESTAGNNRAAKLIAYYGYVFIDAIEEVWQGATDEQLNDIDKITQAIINAMNKRIGTTRNMHLEKESTQTLKK